MNDTELEQLNLIHVLLVRLNEGGYVGWGGLEQAYKELNILIKQRETRLVAEARIDELENIEQLDNTICIPLRPNILDEVNNGDDLEFHEHFIYIDERIAQLKATLKQESEKS